MQGERVYFFGRRRLMDRADSEYGHLVAELMEKKGLNRYKLSLRAAMSWKQVDRYCENDVSRLDAFVLCKLCMALECSIQDLLVFVPADGVQE